MKFGRNVSQVNTNRLTDFWSEVIIWKWRPWRPFTQQSVCRHLVSDNESSAARICSNACQFLIYSSFVFDRSTSVWLLAWRWSFDPVPRRRVVDRLSVSIKPHIVVDVVTVWDKLLKHVVDVLICDDRQCAAQASTKLSRIIPTQHWTVRVETIFLIVHRVALGEGRYDIYSVENKQHTSYKTSTLTV